MKAVLDTSSWYAYINKNDEMHELAVDFVEDNNDYLILETVFEEIIALLQNRFGKKLAASNGQTLIEFGITILTLDEIRNSWKLFLNSPTKVSFVDCTVMLAAQKNNLPIFGFDAHFRKPGMTLVP